MPSQKKLDRRFAEFYEKKLASISSELSSIHSDMIHNVNTRLDNRLPESEEPDELRHARNLVVAVAAAKNATASMQRLLAERVIANR